MQPLLRSARVAAFFLLPLCASAARQPLAMVEIASCNAFSGNVNTLAQAINMPFVAMGVNGWLSQAGSCPNLAGVDVNKPLRLVVWPSATEGRPPDTAAILPLLDQGEVLQGALRGAFKTATQDGDILALTGAPAGIKGDVFVALVGGLAVTGSSRAVVAETAAALKSQTLPAVASISGTVRATLNIQDLVPLLEGQIKNQTAAMRQMTPPAGQPNPGDMLEMQMAGLLAVLRQTQAFSIGLTADEAGVTLYTRTDAVARLTVAQVFALRRPPDPRYRSMLPANALFALVGTGLDAMDLLAEPYAAFTDSLYAKMGPPFAALAPLVRQSLTSAKGLYQGDFALAVSPTADSQGVEFVEFVGVKDESAYARMIRASMTNTMAVMNTNSALGFGMQVGAPRKSGNVEVTPFRYTFNAPATPMMPLPIAPLLAWFNRLQGEWAVSQGQMVMVMGTSNSVARAMDRALASLKAPAANAAPAPRICTLFPEIPAAPVTEWKLATSDVLRLILTATGQANAQKVAQLPPRGEGIGGIELRQGDALFGALRISASELTALAKAFTVLRQPPPGAVNADGRPGATGRPPVPPHMNAAPPTP